MSTIWNGTLSIIHRTIKNTRYKSAPVFFDNCDSHKYISWYLLLSSKLSFIWKTLNATVVDLKYKLLSCQTQIICNLFFITRHMFLVLIEKLFQILLKLCQQSWSKYHDGHVCPWSCRRMIIYVHSHVRWWSCRLVILHAHCHGHWWSSTIMVMYAHGHVHFTVHATVV